MGSRHLDVVLPTLSRNSGASGLQNIFEAKVTGMNVSTVRIWGQKVSLEREKPAVRKRCRGLAQPGGA